MANNSEDAFYNWLGSIPDRYRPYGAERDAAHDGWREALKWQGARLEQAEALLGRLVAAGVEADALFGNIFKAVPWGKTFNLDIARLNTVPPRIAQLAADAAAFLAGGGRGGNDSKEGE